MKNILFVIGFFLLFKLNFCEEDDTVYMVKRGQKSDLIDALTEVYNKIKILPNTTSESFIPEVDQIINSVESIINSVVSNVTNFTVK